MSQQHSSDLLTSFIEQYNEEQQQQENLEQRNAWLEEHYTKSQLSILSLTESIESKNKDLLIASKGILDAEKLAKTSAAQSSELIRVRALLTAVQQELTTFKCQGDKSAQVKRLKETNTEQNKKITRLTTELKDAKYQAHRKGDELALTLKIVEAQKEEQQSGGINGLYHNEDHHLVVWPQKTTMQRTDGTTFTGTNLLYLHQSGRGGFITFDPVSGESKLCDAPKAGLRIPKSVSQFANEWLYKVNTLQEGELKTEDRASINYNN